MLSIVSFEALRSTAIAAPALHRLQARVSPEVLLEVGSRRLRRNRSSSSGSLWGGRRQEAPSGRRHPGVPDDHDADRRRDGIEQVQDRVQQLHDEASRRAAGLARLPIQLDPDPPTVARSGRFRNYKMELQTGLRIDDARRSRRSARRDLEPLADAQGEGRHRPRLPPGRRTSGTQMRPPALGGAASVSEPGSARAAGPLPRGSRWSCRPARARSRRA